MHGGKSTGAPKGKAHYAYRHGLYTKEAQGERRFLRELLRQAKETLAEMT